MLLAQKLEPPVISMLLGTLGALKTIIVPVKLTKKRGEHRCSPRKFYVLKKPLTSLMCPAFLNFDIAFASSCQTRLRVIQSSRPISAKVYFNFSLLHLIYP